MTALLRQASVAQRFSMSLVAVFAGTAVVLATVALYGLLALLVGRRTREIGVRLALGATRWDVARLILNRTLPLVLIGVVIGMVASGAFGRVLQSLLFGISATDRAPTRQSRWASCSSGPWRVRCRFAVPSRSTRCGSSTSNDAAGRNVAPPAPKRTDVNRLRREGSSAAPA